ncbi:MAG: ABC transporter ATP-binding protein [Lachnospiraceae bacterium]|nr:ABC transporter ATP-binding protein [Lachnospiraceae bacterium]
MMADRMVSITNLTKEYRLYERPGDRVKEVFSMTGKKYGRPFYALQGINMDVKAGETVGIIGTNGAGKSTLLKIITGVLSPTGGKVAVNGKIAALLELGAGFHPEYTGLQNIYLNGRIMGYSRRQMDDKVQGILDFADIGDFISQPVKTYSSGMFARLAFSVAVSVEPDLLIVDEALSVGDLFFQNKCFRKFEELKSKGVTILFVSHDIGSVRQMCSRVLWLEQGAQKQFGPCGLVCDRYMDEKRKRMNEGTAAAGSGSGSLLPQQPEGKRTFPALRYRSSDLVSESFRFLSCFVREAGGNITTEMYVEREYEFHMVIEFYEDMDRLIGGFVFENRKGLPIYDINNYMNQGQTWQGRKGQVSQLVFRYRLPKIMKGTYLVSAALAQGTQENHKMLTWLHGVLEITVYNDGYNSSYIEIPSKISLRQFERSQIRIAGEDET